MMAYVFPDFFLFLEYILVISVRAIISTFSDRPDLHEIFSIGRTVTATK